MAFTKGPDVLEGFTESFCKEEIYKLRLET